MSSQFIGLTVFITLKDAENTQLRGIVADVVMSGQDNELDLTNVFFPQTGYVLNNFRINGKDIGDLRLVGEDFMPPPVQRPPPPQQVQIPQQHQQQQQQQQISMPHGPYGQDTMSPIPPYYGHFPPQGHQPPHAPHHQVPAQSFSHPAQPASAPVPAPVPFEDPAIIAFSRKPSAVSLLAATSMPPPPQVVHEAPSGYVAPTAPQAPVPTVHATHELSSSSPLPPLSPPFPITPTRSPAHPSAASMSRNNSMMGLNQNHSQGPVNKPAVSAPLNARVSASASLELPARNEPNRGVSAVLQRPFAEMALSADAADSSALDETDDGLSSMAPETPYNRHKFTGKRSRRGRGALRRQQPQFESQPEEPAKSTVLQPGMFAGAIAKAAVASAGMGNIGMSHGSHGNGARNQPRRNRNSRRGTGIYANPEEEGWATEDVADYKEHEFDFQGNLDRFDKKTVFSQIKAEDTTADEARLVSFNRRPSKPLKPVKKNYLHTENVLGSFSNGQSLATDDWNSADFIAEESFPDESDNESELDLPGRGVSNALDSGRSSRRALSRASLTRRSKPHLRSTSTRRASIENLTSTSTKPTKPSLRLQPTNRPCPIISPLQMLDVERIAEVELGLTDDMMTENAGRGIAQVALQAFGKRISAYRTSTPAPKNALPLVLVFAGNNKSGSRAIAAGRHMKNHHVRVMVCVLGLEREEELLENVRRQLNVFRNAGGRVARWEEMQTNLKTLDAPPELIVDGLLGMHLGFEDLRTDDQQAAYELVQFANKSKANVLSVDIPSGVDGSTGKLAELDDHDTPLYIRANWVVCMGAPKSGLLNALMEGVGSAWKLYVADIGISNTAWRKYGTRRRHGVEFATEWVVGLNYHPGGPAA